TFPPTLTRRRSQVSPISRRSVTPLLLLPQTRGPLCSICLPASSSLFSFFIVDVFPAGLVAGRRAQPPRILVAVHPLYKVPHRAEVTIGVAVAILAAFTDIRHAIGFSSFAVLTYYAVTNASALTLRNDEGKPPYIVPVVGLLGCLALAFSMPLRSIV